MIIGWIILGIVGTFLLVERGFRSYVVPRIRDIFENVPPFNVIAEPEDPNARQISFQNTDGQTLRGSLLNADVRNPPGLVLFLPELRGTHWMARRYCQALLNQGFVVLSFDFRNQGSSDSQDGYAPIHWMTEFEMTDVDAALQFVESNERLSTLPLIAFGVSRGGVAALLTGCRYPRIRCVIADSAFGTMAMIRYFVDRFVKLVIPESVFRFLPKWHVEATLRQAVALSERNRKCRYAHLDEEVNGLDASSVLLISGSRDSYVTPTIAVHLHQVVGTNAELWIVTGAKHNMSRSVQPEEYDQRIMSHVARCLGLALPQEAAESPSMKLAAASDSRAMEDSNDNLAARH